MAVNCEKIVKNVLKNLSKIMDVDYEKVKAASKKGLKMAKTYDEELLGIMEALMDLPNVESEEELADFDPQVLQIPLQPHLHHKEQDPQAQYPLQTLQFQIHRDPQQEFEEEYVFL